MEANFEIQEVDLRNDQLTFKAVQTFLLKFNLVMDEVDSTLIIKENNEIVATASKYYNVIKCVAVNDSLQNLNIAATLIGEMIKKINAENYNEAFIFTKPIYATSIGSLGFKQIWADDKISFLTNRKDLLTDYLTYLRSQTRKGKKNCAIVMNANPFTFGHLYLIEKACEHCDNVYIIVVKNELSLFTYKQRLKMIHLGTRSLSSVIVLDGSEYQVSAMTFPSYFLKSTDEVIKQQTLLDVGIFCDYFVPSLKLTDRYVGQEPLSKTTELYNEAMQQLLPKHKVKLTIIPRKQYLNEPISGTASRSLFIKKDWNGLANFCPKEVVEFLKELDWKTLNQQFLKVKKNW